MCMQEKMAVVLMCAARLLFLFLLNSIVVSCGSGNRPVQNVPEPLIQSALNSLNEDSPTHHTYKGGNLISAQKLDESPYVIYRLTFDLTPVCKESLEPCPREACTVEVKQHQRGDINVLRESIQCMYLYPQLPQDEPSHAQENQEHEIIENLEKQIITNQSVELDHEIQKTGEHNEKPFIAMRASSPNYCPGCPYELNPNLPGLAAFGEQAAKSMDEYVQNDYKHKAVEIIKVTRAVPPSSNVIQYRILLRIGESDCLKNAIEQNMECSVQESLPIKTCQITFEEQPWQQLSRRITKNNCTVSNYIESKIDPYSTLGVESLVTPAPKKQEVDPAKAQALENLKNILDNYTNAVTAKVEEQQRPEVTEHPMVKVSLNRSDDDTKPQGFEDKLKEFTEFVKDFDLPVREAKSNPETNREEVVEESIIPKKVSADPTTNENLQRNRRMLGAPKTMDVNDPEIQEAANEGLKQLSEGHRGTNELIITEVVEASKQIVSGTLYKIKARVGTSTCAKGAKANCKLQEGSEIQECLFSIWSQPWIDNGSSEIKINCHSHSQQKRSLHGDELFVSNERFKRKSGIPGAPHNADVNDPEILEAANKGLKKLSESYQGTTEPIITEIVEASKQTVSGTLYKIKAKVGPSTCAKGVKDSCQLQEGSEIQECLFSVWSQPWVDKGSAEITVNCNLQHQKKRSIHGDELLTSDERFKRELPLRGEAQAADINDPQIQEATNKGLKKFSLSYEGEYEPIITEIVEASKQTVSGTLYKIKAKIGQSTCAKGAKENCKLQEGSEIQECLFSIWSQPWIDFGYPNIEISCNARNQQENPRTKRESDMPGAPVKKPVNDPEIKNLAKKGLKKFSENSEGTHEPMIVEIVDATQQVVSGLLYKIKVKLGTSTCPRGVKGECKLKEGSDIKVCLFTIWSQPWIDNGSPEITINCDLANRRKRSLRGADYNNKMLKIAEEAATDIKEQYMFEKFIKEYEKKYSSADEKQSRYEIFKKNLEVIQEMRKAEQGTAKYGVTMFADLSPEEFRSKYLGYRPHLRQENAIPFPEAEIPDIELPPKFDWRDHHVVTPVKDQGQCGSCWAFSVTGNVESQYAIRHGKLLSLSEQELVDCDSLDLGCGGGEMDNAYTTIEKLGGLELESDYPYDARNEKCEFNKGKAVVNVVDALHISSNETKMAQWLVKNGPISIAINANAMQFYMGGVSHPLKFLCNPKDLDHGVLIVGYGTSVYPIFKKVKPYWIIKNSWGPRWGEQGYYRVYRGDGTCGLNKTPSSAIVA
ncbi:uncharacterized protein LOC143210642 [Lasioglossum baleicum]|uniref:uncharacterized protein LOC143210642 n=1 Tax=Lasioglossum baleicum TaxID=434251 RepID=UPI003FCD78B2